MINVENVIAWSAVERSAEPARVSGDIDVVASDLFRAVRFYSRVFGLLPAPRSSGAMHQALRIRRERPRSRSGARMGARRQSRARQRRARSHLSMVERALAVRRGTGRPRDRADRAPKLGARVLPSSGGRLVARLTPRAAADTVNACRRAFAGRPSTQPFAKARVVGPRGDAT